MKVKKSAIASGIVVVVVVIVVAVADASSARQLLGGNMARARWRCEDKGAAGDRAQKEEDLKGGRH